MTSALHAALLALDKVILGKSEAVRLALACLLARGHLLIEDVPGVGKTTLAHALAHVLGLAWQRVQFTSDLLPADIIGVSVFDATNGSFTFRKGPMFTQLLLADEVNRASPKTQSALLEAMEERQVSVDVTTYRLPDPFFVVATQNPFEQLGTFGLPESQLDRFLMRISLGYPDAAHERVLLAEGDRRDLLAGMPPALNPEAVRELQAAAQRVHVAPGVARIRAGAARQYAPPQRHPDRPVATRRPGPDARGARLGHDRGPRHGAARGRAGGVRRGGLAPAGERGRRHRRRSRCVHRRDRPRRPGPRLTRHVRGGEHGGGAPGACACASARLTGRSAARATIACRRP